MSSREGWWAFLLREDPNTLLPGVLAAERARVSRQLIHHWRVTGRLPVAEWRDGRPFYRLGDVLLAESETRAHVKSHRPLRMAVPA